MRDPTRTSFGELNPAAPVAEFPVTWSGRYILDGGRSWTQGQIEMTFERLE